MSLLDIVSKESQTVIEPSPEPEKKQEIPKATSRLVPRTLAKKSNSGSPKSASKPPLVKAKESSPKPIITILEESSNQDNTIQQVTPKFNKEDVIISFNVPDLYDPCNPNSFYEAVLLPMEREIEIQKQSEDDLGNPELEDESTSNESGILSSHSNSIDPAFGEKMLYRYGWKGSGHGLGKEGQGIATPWLLTQNSSSNSGPIGTITRAPVLNTQSSRVLLLLNLIDQEHEDEEIKQEASDYFQKFGSVLSVTLGQSDHNESSSSRRYDRVFILFDNQESARRAKDGANGKIVNGKRISIHVYPEPAFFDSNFTIPFQSPS